MQKIGIIGGGFTGIMTAVQLIKQTAAPLHLVIINEKENFIKGIAYNPYSKEHLLNVISGKMSAFPDVPNHFTKWLLQQPEFLHIDETLLANAYLPRYLYGAYLEHVWHHATEMAKQKHVVLECVYDWVADIDIHPNSISLFLKSKKTVTVDYCVIASGNQLPADVRISNTPFFKSERYYKNPWDKKCVLNTQNDSGILIIGNGLTMVDTVLGLLENNFHGDIFSISPNGFNILPHRNQGLNYTKLAEELQGKSSLYDIYKLVHKHIKIVRKFGISAEAVIDSIRPLTQNLWKNLSLEDKRLFMSRFRHLWGVARHRIPLNIHDKIQQLRLEGKLTIIAGRIIDIEENANGITIQHINKKNTRLAVLNVSRVINCTGPETNIAKMNMNFLQSAFFKNILQQDELNLGISTDTNTFEVIDKNGHKNHRLHTIGSNLKGELWESTAVNELRSQAEKIAGVILNKVNEPAVSTTMQNIISLEK